MWFAPQWDGTRPLERKPIAGASVPEIDPQSRIIFDCFYQHDPGVLAGLFTKRFAPLLRAFAFDNFAAVLAAVNAGDGFHFGLCFFKILLTSCAAMR